MVIKIRSVNRDTSTYGPLYASSQISQKNYDFSNIFKAFSVEAPIAVSPTPAPIVDQPVIVKPLPKPEPSLPAPGTLFSTKSIVPLPTGLIFQLI
jgi:hypothetical protein